MPPPPTARGLLDDALWAAMLRQEISKRDCWARRAREIGARLGHANWSTRELMTWLYHRPDADFVFDEWSS